MKLLISISIYILTQTASASCGIGPVFEEVQDQAVVNKTISIIASSLGFSLTETKIKARSVESQHYIPDISHLAPDDITGGSACPVADYKIALTMSGNTWLYNAANQSFGSLNLAIFSFNKASINNRPVDDFYEKLNQKVEDLYNSSTLTQNEKFDAIEKFYQTPFQCGLNISVQVSTNSYTDAGELFSYDIINKIDEFQLDCKPL